jgi:hypothetical protein
MTASFTRFNDALLEMERTTGRPLLRASRSEHVAFFYAAGCRWRIDLSPDELSAMIVTMRTFPYWQDKAGRRPHGPWQAN